jgi:hypothetical protein
VRATATPLKDRLDKVMKLLTYGRPVSAGRIARRPSEVSAAGRCLRPWIWGRGRRVAPGPAQPPSEIARRQKRCQRGPWAFGARDGPCPVRWREDGVRGARRALASGFRASLVSSRPTRGRHTEGGQVRPAKGAAYATCEAGNRDHAVGPFGKSLVARLRQRLADWRLRRYRHRSRSATDGRREGRQWVP